MAWIESHQTLGHHPKTQELATLLHCTLPAAVGYLHYLWWWSLDFAQDGFIAKRSVTVVKVACFYTGPGPRFFDALVRAGFVETRDDGWVIHDWLEYAGRLVVKREDAKLRAAAWREQQQSRTHTERIPNAYSRGRARGAPAGVDRTVPNLNPTVPDPYPLPPPATAAGGGDAPPEGPDEKTTNGSTMRVDMTRQQPPPDATVACCPNFAATGSEHWQFCTNAASVDDEA